ncbi:unnamed protein product [Rotaria magnacalcarata]
MNKNYNLILRKYLNIKQQENDELTLENNQTDAGYPYFSQSFYTLTSNNMSHFVLSSLPSYVKYNSSKPNESLIDEKMLRLRNNLTRRSIEISSSDFIYQIQAYDPDLLFHQQTNPLQPSIEYEIDPQENLEIEHYTDRIFLKKYQSNCI